MAILKMPDPARLSVMVVAAIRCLIVRGSQPGRAVSVHHLSDSAETVVISLCASSRFGDPRKVL